jgi:catechol 2,3-dioxygenase
MIKSRTKKGSGSFFIEKASSVKKNSCNAVLTENYFDIVRTAHVEFKVRDLERSRDFYVNTLGLLETYSDDSTIYLRGLEDRFSHSLILSKTAADGEPSVDHISYRVRSEKDLDSLARLFESESSKVRWLEEGEEERARGRAIRAQDPFGFPVEFFSRIDESEWTLQRFDKYAGARIMRIDHVNVLTPDVAGLSNWYTDKLGFLCSEYTETEETDETGKPGLWATWLRRKPTVHDIAIMSGEGPRLHHAGFYVAEKDSILDAADILASRGYTSSIERGPGRHGISNAFFLYLRDPDGHRIELYTGDYLSADPDWKPLKWKLNDPQRQTFWGAPAPERWFREASKVRSVYDGKLVNAVEPTNDPRRRTT